MFVYFSHYFVTVPPLGWVRAAHKHGNMILGQFGMEASAWQEPLFTEKSCSDSFNHNDIYRNEIGVEHTVWPQVCCMKGDYSNVESLMKDPP